MKLSRIKLTDYYQFKDLDIDLTYPQGHKKAGEPLDKVCFLGQSGTGKTTLLRLIKWFISQTRDIGENIDLPVPTVADTIQMDFRLFEPHLEYRVGNRTINEKLDLFLYYDWPDDMDKDSFFDRLKEDYTKSSPVLINFPTELLWRKNRPHPVSLDAIDELEKIKLQDQVPPGLGKRRVIDFAVADITKQWEYILNSIRKHRAVDILYKNKIADATLRKEESAAEKKTLKKIKDEYEKWQTGNRSPLNSLAEDCLDPILSRLGLKVKLYLDEKSVDNLGFIGLQTLSGLDVPYEFWSTGTRQLIQTLLPLYQLNPRQSVILVDEPERSLYPDIQRYTVETYIKRAPDSQFFFATHSPVITAAFEPWEIVELKFDNQCREVYRECYYEENNHVDNYMVYPEYMRWDSILQRVFDLDEEGSEKRAQGLKRLIDLEMRIEQFKNKNKLDSPKGRELVDEFLLLNRKLGWRSGKRTP
ncbi:MAG: AAA family ATPase [bacterium]|nr:AAA family ATPase [bacterium]